MKVLDFGLAKLQEESPVDGLSVTVTEEPLTGEGRIIGTVAYMSPEQAQGKAVDARSDVFSLGILLFEMATGEKPFKGDTNMSLLSAIIKDTPLVGHRYAAGPPARCRQDPDDAAWPRIPRSDTRRPRTCATICGLLKEDLDTGVGLARPDVPATSARARVPASAAPRMASAARFRWRSRRRWPWPSPAGGGTRGAPQRRRAPAFANDHHAPPHEHGDGEHRRHLPRWPIRRARRRRFRQAEPVDAAGLDGQQRADRAADGGRIRGARVFAGWRGRAVRVRPRERRGRCRCFGSRFWAARRASWWRTSAQRRRSRRMASAWRSSAAWPTEDKSSCSPTRTAPTSAVWRRAPESDAYAQTRVAWSPDGTQIAAFAGEMPKQRSRIVLVNVESGKEQVFSDARFDSGGQLTWLGDGSASGVRCDRAVRRTLELEQPALVDRVPGWHPAPDHSRPRDLCERRRNRGRADAGGRAG